MKKLAHVVMSLMLTFAAALSLVGCGKSPVVSATTKGLALSIPKGQELVLKNVTVTAKYKNKKTKNFSGKDLTFGEFSTEELGTYKLPITIVPEEYTFEVPIKVVPTEADVNAIIGLNSQLVTEYKGNKSNNGRFEQFANQNEPIYAGTQNPFHFRLKVSGIGADGETLVPEVAQVRTIIKVELIEDDGETYTELTGTSLSQYVDVEDINAVFKFKDAAIGKSFRISVEAANPDPRYSTSNYSFVADKVSVIEGFNVYDVVDLSAFDNVNVPEYTRSTGFVHTYKGQGWAAEQAQVKARYGIQDLSTINTFILQSDINLNADNVREDFLWSESDTSYAMHEATSEDDDVLGKPHNLREYGLFAREIANGTQLKLIGNYFAINATEIPLMTTDESVTDGSGDVNFAESRGMTAYTSLFKTSPKITESITDPDTKVFWENIAFVGNGSMEPDCRTSGSLLLMKHSDVKFEGKNMTSNMFYMSYYFDFGNPLNPNDGEYVVRDSKAFNSYSALASVYGAENTTFINCTLENSGGPAILAESLVNDGWYTNGSWQYTAEQFRPDGEGQDLAPTLNLVGCTVKSYLSGQEGWFNTYPGSGAVVGQLATWDGVQLNPTEGTKRGSIIADYKQSGDKSVPRINIMVALYGPGIVSNTYFVTGVVNIYENEEAYNASTLLGKMNLDAQGGANMPKYVANNFNCPMFECTSTGAYIPCVPGTGAPENHEPGWAGDYMNIYMNSNGGYMGILTGFTPAEEEAA